MPPAPPRLSIGLPVYNGARYLRTALDSIVRQSFTDVEIIVADNASTDATPEIAQAYAARDDRIRFVRHTTNRGAAGNFNYVLQAARAPLFRWACDDDVLAPDCLQACLDALRAHPQAVLAYPATQMIDADGEQLPNTGFSIRSLHLPMADPVERFRHYLWRYLHGGLCTQQFGIVRTDVLRRVGGLGGYPAADIVMLGALLLHGPIVEAPGALMYRRDHPNNSSHGYATAAARAAWFDPANTDRLVLPAWRFVQAYRDAIADAPLTTAQRLICQKHVVTVYMRYHRRNLFRECCTATRHAIRSYLAPRPPVHSVPS
ncbi:glycosyltransferase family 2 protein [Salisaeta longa]|uniref:glycosyltransferase family 2 protein n=1 Tax=Salisaeta longa TaxID=503170 RepID=UPI0003B63797|nr:glycosyltransferase family A protein [Salisaeta longa]